MTEILNVSLQMDHERQGSYFTLPFRVPAGIESIAVSYRYQRHPEAEQALEQGTFTARKEANVVDLGLLDPQGEQVGASGSDKTEVLVSERWATPGYRPCAIAPGTWQILVGAYKVAREGVRVEYELRLEPKRRRLLKGDLHTHTLASDGVHTAEELAWKALRSGLDFLAITDHNQFVSRDALPQVEGLTLIPGVEWTHYQGHAGFLWVELPYDGPFAANSLEEARVRFETARDRGALVTINHPFDPGYGFLFEIEALPHHCIEIWNGPMREANLRALGYWHHRLCAGDKVAACGGSDYHRDTPFFFLGGPTMGVYAESHGPSDILAAVRAGHSFITFSPVGPVLELAAGAAIMGDTVRWPAVQEVQLRAQGLQTGDTVHVVTGRASELLFSAPSAGDVLLSYRVQAPGFVRAEVRRAFVPGTPPVPAALSNPIYFEGEEPASPF